MNSYFETLSGRAAGPIKELPVDGNTPITHFRLRWRADPALPPSFQVAWKMRLIGIGRDLTFVCQLSEHTR